MKRRIGVYPGTFDPITNGHMDIIQRASRLVDHLIVGVARNAGKGPLFSTDERVAMVREDVTALNNAGASIEVRAFDTLPKIETMFLMASEKSQFISSRFVKEIGRLGGDIRGFVSGRVAEHLAERFALEDGNGDANKKVQTLKQ